MKTKLVLLMTLWSSFSLASGMRTSDVLICANGTNKPLDYYESEQFRQRPEKLVGATLDEAFDNLLGRLAENFPTDAQRLNKWRLHFAEEALALSGTDLVSTGKPANLPIPHGCEVKAVIGQKEKDFPEDPTYLLNKTLWSSLSPKTQAGVLMNALMTRDTENEIRTSPNARDIRRWNAFLATNEYKNITLDKDWQTVVNEFKVTHLLYKGLCDMSVSHFYDEGSIQDCRAPSEAVLTIDFQGQKLQVVPAKYLDIPIYGWGSYEFSRDGRVIGFSPVSKKNFVIGGLTVLNPINIYVYENGALKKLEFGDYHTGSVQVTWRGNTWQANRNVGFYPNGQLQYIKQFDRLQLRSSKKNLNFYEIYFDEKGEIANYAE